MAMPMVVMASLVTHLPAMAVVSVTPMKTGVMLVSGSRGVPVRDHRKMEDPVHDRAEGPQESQHDARPSTNPYKIGASLIVGTA